MFFSRWTAILAPLIALVMMCISSSTQVLNHFEAASSKESWAGVQIDFVTTGDTKPIESTKTKRQREGHKKKQQIKIESTEKKQRPENDKQQEIKIQSTGMKQKWEIVTKKGHKIVVDAIQAWEGKSHPEAEKASKEKPYVAETHYFHGDFPVSKIVSGGPAAPYYDTNNKLIWPAKDQEDAVCYFRTSSFNPRMFPGQLPHMLQQMLRCFSWWQLNPHQQPVVMFGKLPRNIKAMIMMYKLLNETYGLPYKNFNNKSYRKNTPYVTVEAPWENMTQFNETYIINAKHAAKLRDDVLDYLEPNSTTRAGCGRSSKPVIAFVNREDALRKISNHKEIISALQEAGYKVIYKDSFKSLYTLQHQIKFMSRADIVMGPHGAQFSNTLWQPECGSLLEFFPRSYYVPNFFGSLAALSGKYHFFTYPGGQTIEAKAKTRERTVEYPVLPEVVVELTHKMVERWHSCCEYGFRAKMD